MATPPDELARRVLGKEWDRLPEGERHHILELIPRLSTVQGVDEEFNGRTAGARAADRIATFGGSWTFVLIFLVVIAVWAIVNTVVLRPTAKAFDPYPFVFLNLMLSTLAALQAPIILMAQNRQAARDRLAAARDYEVNLRAELSVRRLHQKLDHLRDEPLAELVSRHREHRALPVKDADGPERTPES
ncbi:MAG: DUF1003 domain-containing protein [Gemmatimonadales bacterium]